MKIRLEGTKNTRDFSEYGYRGYIRSAHLNGLSAHDIETLITRYQLKTVIDLRTPQEVAEKPDVTLPDVTYLHVPIFENAIPGISHESASDNPERTPERMKAMLPDMPAMYRALVSEEPYLSQIRKVMEIIADKNREGAILWHCTEGKDRCGMISALFLLSHGISPQEVMKDYLKTNRVNRAKAWKYYFLILLSGKGSALAGQVRDVFLAKRSYLEPIMKILERLAAGQGFDAKS